jgi:hypothetical protein
MVACFDSTGRILADRRLRTLAELDASTASAVTMTDLGRAISKGLTFNAYDIPFALVYFCETDFGLQSSNLDFDLARRSSTDSTSNNLSEYSEGNDPSITSYVLQSTVGIPEDHALAPREVEINSRLSSGSSNEERNDVWPFRKMALEQRAIDISLEPDQLEGIKQQGWPEFPKAAVAMPIFGARDLDGKEIMTGMMVVGINPRRVFDDDYLTWIRICSRHIAAAMHMVKNAEDAAQSAEDLAISNRNRTTFFNR